MISITKLLTRILSSTKWMRNWTSFTSNCRHSWRKLRTSIRLRLKRAKNAHFVITWSRCPWVTSQWPMTRLMSVLIQPLSITPFKRTLLPTITLSSSINNLNLITKILELILFLRWLVDLTQVQHPLMPTMTFNNSWMTLETRITLMKI